MNREEFAKRLDSVVVPEGTSAEEMRKITFPISEAISQMMPPSLFRCRRCDVNSIVALKNDIIYAGTADDFNDPYDTLARYDLETLEEGINRVMCMESLEQLKMWIAQGNDFPEGVKQVLPEAMLSAFREKLLALEDFSEYEPRIGETRRTMISMMRKLFPVLAEASQRYCRVACFSESVDSILMWSHYADFHMGFVLEYDFRRTLKNPIENVLIAPVIYDEERLDVSSYIAWEFLHLLGVNSKNPDIASHIKVALHKSAAWAYENEWRLVDCTFHEITDKTASAIPYRPRAIYYGARMDAGKKGLLHGIAQEKGIRDYEMYIDYSSPVYEVKYRPYGSVGTEDVSG